MSNRNRSECGYEINSIFWWKLKLHATDAKVSGWISKTGQFTDIPQVEYVMPEDQIDSTPQYGWAAISSNTQMGSNYQGYFDDIRLVQYGYASAYAKHERFDDGYMWDWNDRYNSYSIVGGSDKSLKLTGYVGSMQITPLEFTHFEAKNGFMDGYISAELNRNGYFNKDYLYLRASGIHENGFDNGIRLMFYQGYLYLDIILDNSRVKRIQSSYVGGSTGLWSMKLMAIGDHITAYLGSGATIPTNPTLSYTLTSDEGVLGLGSPGIASRDFTSDSYYTLWDELILVYYPFILSDSFIYG